jgi:hypothetical protein
MCPVTVRRAEKVELGPEPASVGHARRFVRRVLTDWGFDELVDTVALLTSELATNALLHARTGFAVVVSRDDEQVRVDVLDGSGVAPRQRTTSATAITGRGIAMVAQLATSWGPTPPRELGGYAKGVFFTVPLVGVGEAAWHGSRLEEL